MNKILFEGVRCFHTLRSCSVKPITLLVGENSSGKTTFLALNRIAWDIAQGNIAEDFFNEDPFFLGSYDQIASYRGGKAGRAKSFMVGLQIPLRLDQEQSAAGMFADHAKISARFTSLGSQSKLEEWTFQCGNFSVLGKHEPNQSFIELTFKTPKGQFVDSRLGLFPGALGFGHILSFLQYVRTHRPKGAGADSAQSPAIVSEAEFELLVEISNQIMASYGPRPFAFAPIRTRPLRTYDPLKDVQKPEGSHVPMVLARTFLEKSESNNRLRDSLISFGRSSGLFNGMEVKRKGHKESDPFQIGVKTIGPTFNLVDVGYGVSQVLPIIVDVVQSPKGSSFLLQQPEVHLHPKAQAELGSFLATLAKAQNKRFVIETHSDYLIDRIRMDIRDKKSLSPDEVAILYFERSKAGVRIHPLDIDEFGNIVKAPPTYRQFFLQEERRLFGA